MSDRPIFEIYQAPRWADLKALSLQLRFPYAFRGQPSADYKLSTHMERAARRGGLPGNYIAAQESWMIHQFQRRAHHFVSDLPQPEDLLDWLALIQHHGGPTRLLDFTHSFWVSLFFATEQADADAAVWAIDLVELANRAAHFAGDASLPSYDRREVLDRHGRHAERILREPPEQAFVLDVEPLRMNPRMASQQGLFLLPTRVDYSFEANLLGTFGLNAEAIGRSEVLYWDQDQPFQPPIIAKLIIPLHWRGPILHDLERMNVTSVSLFGGVDGLARSLATRLNLDDLSA